MVRIDDSGAVPKCWLSPEELDRLERIAGDTGWKREIAVPTSAQRATTPRLAGVGYHPARASPCPVTRTLASSSRRRSTTTWATHFERPRTPTTARRPTPRSPVPSRSSTSLPVRTLAVDRRTVHAAGVGLVPEGHGRPCLRGRSTDGDRIVVRDLQSRIPQTVILDRASDRVRTCAGLRRPNDPATPGELPRGQAQRHPS